MRRSGRRDTRGAQCVSARYGSVLSDRSRRQCHARRNDLDARLRHDDRALWNDCAERARARSRTGERRSDPLRRTRPQVVGWLRLVRVFTGAEGTLGIITEATLRLHGQPEAVGSGVCSFPQLRGAVEAVIELIQSGAPLARIEFLDEVQIRACNAYSKLSLAEQPTLFIEFNGTDASVAEQFERATEIVRSHGAPGFEWASDEKQRAALWRARHSAYFAALSLRPGCECVVADVCVPISKLAECVAATRAEIDATSLIAPIVGHVGDGNFHVLFLLQPGDAEERARMESVYDGMIALAHRLGGTCTGEHGIGMGKRDKLVAEFGEPVVTLMRRLKEAWDPHDILNPGKIFHTT